jgi:hypothetical protein
MPWGRKRTCCLMREILDIIRCIRQSHFSDTLYTEFVYFVIVFAAAASFGRMPPLGTGVICEMKQSKIFPDKSSRSAVLAPTPSAQLTLVVSQRRIWLAKPLGRIGNTSVRQANIGLTRRQKTSRKPLSLLLVAYSQPRLRAMKVSAVMHLILTCPCGLRRARFPKPLPLGALPCRGPGRCSRARGTCYSARADRPRARNVLLFGNQRFLGCPKRATCRSSV